MGRQLVLSLGVAVAMLAAAGGVVLSVSKGCDQGVDCVGTRGADTLTGDNGSHHIAGLEGNDIITGGSNHDFIYGDEGNDTITDDGGNDLDVIYGDEGNDTINVREGNGVADIVDCGPGKKDRVFFDPADTITHCEIKNPDQ
jgi:Ca2+-binding RTX toxin-like protein